MIAHFLLVVCLIALVCGEVVEEVSTKKVSARELPKRLGQQIQKSSQKPVEAAHSNLRKKATAADVVAGDLVLLTVHDGDCKAPATQHIFYSPDNAVFTSASEFGFFTCTVGGIVYKTHCTNDLPPVCINTELGLDGTCVDFDDMGTFTLSCIADTTVLKQYTGMQAEIGFVNADLANSGSLSNMQFMAIDYDLDRVLPLPPDERMECNTELTAEGVCADTRNIRSIAYFAKDWQEAYLNLYPRKRGQGKPTVIEYTEGNYLADIGQVTTWRYLVKGWYEDHFETSP
eukprot:gene26773-32351_t